ncbi:metallophosphatase family protein [Flavobacteriaceae bacterium]|nr:metallophosphatase family protein [Flavobacteriaceae bacterium]
MKSILLISDTHNLLDEFILNHIKNVDEVWHAGDVGEIEIFDQIQSITKLRMVYGNIDNKTVRAQVPENQVFECEGVKVFMTHIGGYPNRYDKRIKPLLLKERPNLFISGHSHILKVVNDPKLNLLHMNPGAAGKHGFHKKRTMLKFEVSKGEIKNLVLIEKDK